jgi:DNA gyrase subunit A
MIFDERDLDNRAKKKTQKEKITPLEEQLSFADLANKEATTKEAPEKTAPEKVAPTATQIEESLEESTEEEEVFEEQKEEIILDEDGNINKGIRQVIHESMIPYSEYVILDRALPRVEDGLKPVQRRILYSMYELGLTPDKPFKKSAKVVGDCMANYHPHGDSSVYNAMVRMSQHFNMRDPLVKGHGNFGSMDGDSAAAMRYTEAKLSKISIELLKDINKDTVRFSPNYDDSKKEPDMLPGRFPNLLVNGSSGIAVGLATNIPPHNLGETIDGVIAYIDKKRITLEEIMKYIKGPDFPMGGLILGEDGIKDAYATGKGKVILRAKTHIEGTRGTKQCIVVDEFPYQVNKANLLAKIAKLREDRKDILGGISEIRDESDRNGVRSVIYLRKDTDEQIILNYLFKHTDLQTSFGVNMVAIAGGKPKQLSLLEIISYYTEYQREVVLRRTKFDLESARKREHIVSGLLIAIKNIDEVIRIIKKSSSTNEAKINLKAKFVLTERQAQAVLDMRLARLTNLEVERLEKELRELLETINKLNLIVNSKNRQMTIVKKEMLEIKKAYATNRRTKIIKDAEDLLDLQEDKFIPIKEVIVAVNERGCIKKIPQKSFSMTARVIGEKSNLNEVHRVVISTETDKKLLLFTNRGLCHRLSLDPVIEARWKDRGSKLNELLKHFEAEEKVVAMFPVKDKFPKGEFMFFTKNGMVKKTAIADYNVKKAGFDSLKLKEDDELINVEILGKDKTMSFITKEGMILKAITTEVPIQGRLSGGVKGIKLTEKDTVLYAGLTSEKDKLAIVTTKGYCKKVEAKEVDAMAKYRKGVKVASLGMDNGFDLVYAGKANHAYELYIVNDKNKVVSLNTDYMPVESRTTKGKLITKGKKTVKIKHIYKYEWETTEFMYNKKK